MAYRIIENGTKCIEGNLEKTWQQVYEEIERGKSPSFILWVEDNLNSENDDLGWVLDFGLCMWTHLERQFYLRISCPEKAVFSAGNKFANFLRYFIEAGILELKINGMLKTTERVKKEVPDAYFPMLAMDADVYKVWFLNSLSEDDRLKTIFCGQESEQNVSTKGDTYFYSEMAMKVCRKMLHPKAGQANEKLKERLEIIYEECLKNYSIMTVLISCILFNRLKERIRLSGNEAIELLKKIVKVAYVYKLGLQEVCENILRHTDRKKGIVYLRTLSAVKTKERFARSAESLRENMNEEEILKLAERWLELTIIDAGEKGILETQEKSRQGLIETFEWSDDTSGNIFEEQDEIKEIDALIYHKGLKIFNEQIQKSKGMFFVQTINSKSVINYSRKFNEKGKVGKCTVGMGTQYKIWLPMTKENAHFQREDSFESDKIADGYRAYQNYNMDGQAALMKILYKDVCADYKIQGGKPEVSVKKNTLSECKRILEFIKERKQIFYYFDFGQVRDQHAVKFIYFLALATTRLNLRYMILYNVEERDFNQFTANYQKNIELSRINRVNKNYVFIYNRQGTPMYVTNDFNYNNSERLKKYLWAYRGIYYEDITEVFLESGISPEERSAVLLPVEILNARNEKAFSAPIFEKHMVQLFNNQMADNEKFGLQYAGHVNLGDKIHVKRYFQGELLFDNNYYLSSLAYILARSLGNKKSFFLVGYKKYSSGLLSKMEEYMGDIVKGTYIFDKIDRENKMPKIAEGTEIVIIVPIASTLRTFEKVERYLRKHISGNYNYSYYAFFISRDCEGDVSDLEREFKWNSISRDSIKLESEWPLNTWSQYREIKYFMLFSGGWQHAMQCEQCDEIKFSEKKEPSIEALMETGEDSLNLSVKLGIPYNKDPEGIKCYTKDLDKSVQRDIYSHISQYIIEGHFERSENHFKHYLFCGNYFEGYLLQCQEFNMWMKSLREEFQNTNQDYVNVLLVPEHYSNNSFSKYVNKHVFNENTIIINENFHKEFYSDFTKKYNYLKKIKKIRYIFLDDCVNTGNTWKKVYSLVSRLGDGEKKFYILSLVNRLDYSNKVLLAAQGVECRFFTQIYIPSIKEQDGNCWLCDESIHLERLYNDSLSVTMKLFYENKLKKNQLISIEDENTRDFKVLKERRRNTDINFLITNELYQRMFENYMILQQGKAEEFRKYFGVADDYTIMKNIIGDSVDYRYRIAFVKTLSRPFINNFAGLRNFCINVCMAEFFKMINEDNYTSEDEARLQLKYLIVLIKRFGTLQYRYILKRECFQQILDFYEKRLKGGVHFEVSYLALQYAVAAKQMMLGSEVNSLRFLENFQSELCESGNVIDTTMETSKNKFASQFLKNTFFSRDLIVENAIRNYRMDLEVINQGSNPEDDEERVLDNHTYGYYQRELSCFGIDEKKKGNIFLNRMKKIKENLEGDAVKDGGCEVFGFEKLFQEVLGEVEDFRLYVYQGSRIGEWFRISGDQLNPKDGQIPKAIENDLEEGINLIQYIHWLRKYDKKKCGHIVNIDTHNICVYGDELYINIAVHDGEKVRGIVFTVKTSDSKILLILALYRLLCGMGIEMIEHVTKTKTNSRKVLVLEKVSEMRGEN